MCFCRLDQTLGKPGSWSERNDKDRQKQTVIARLGRLETRVSDVTSRITSVNKYNDVSFLCPFKNRNLSNYLDKEDELIRSGSV